MKYKRLGKTNFNISEISLGTWQVGGGWGQSFDEKVASQIIEKAIDLGVNFLDTADVYDDQCSERTVGKFVRQNRDKLYIATKIGRRISPHVSEGYTPEVLEKYVDEALANTQLDYLDLVQLHCPPTPVFYRDEIYQKLEEIKASGKVRHFGVSVEKVEEALEATKHEVIETVQIIFNMFRQKPIDECFETLKSRDIGIIVRVPLASGLLSGKMTVDRKFHPQDHRHFNRNGEMFDKGETFSGVPLEVGIEAVDKLKAHFGSEEIYKYALKWITTFDAVSTVIPGASKPSQIESNIANLETTNITESDLAFTKSIYDQYIKKYVHDLW